MSAKLTPRELLVHMRVDDAAYARVFVPGCYESRVTIYSQQLRALNLVYALLKERVVEPNGAVVVVGGGIAGLTAAAAAAQQGCHVYLLEKRPRPNEFMRIQRGCAHRWISQTIYDWPLDIERHILPFLHWEAGYAKSVIEDLQGQWDRMAWQDRITTLAGAKDIRLDGTARPSKVMVSWNAGSPKTQFVDAVILAVGFGQERDFAPIPSSPYWDADRWSRDPKGKFLVSGCGDGGLTDFLRILIRDFQHHHIAELVQGEDFAPVKAQLLEVEDEALRRQATEPDKDVSMYLAERYEKIVQVPVRLDDYLRTHANPEVQVALNDKALTPLSLKSSILNRFLASRYLYNPGLRVSTRYLRGELKKAKAGAKKKGWMITLDSGTPESFDEVIVRHGAKSPLGEILPLATAEACQRRFQALGKLDQTREPMWEPQEFFGPAPVSRPSGASDESHAAHLEAEYREFVQTRIQLSAPWLPGLDLESIYQEPLLLPSAPAAELPIDTAPLRLRELLSGERGATGSRGTVGRWLLFGAAGAGKTTLLRRCARELAKDPAAWLPLYASFDQLLSERLPLTEFLAQQALRSGALRTPDVQPLTELLERAAKEGRVVVLLDGLDQLSSARSEDAVALVETLMRSWPLTRVVLACRLFRAPPRLRSHHLFGHAEILPLGADGQQALLERWAVMRARVHEPEAKQRAAAWHQQIRRSQGLVGLAATCLGLSLIAHQLESGQPLLKQPLKLFDSIFTILLNRSLSAEAPFPNTAAVRPALRYLAYQFVLAGKAAMSTAEAEQLLLQDPSLCERLGRVTGWQGNVQSFLRDVTAQTGLLLYQETDALHLRFMHDSFRDALAAEHLAELYGSQGEGALALARLCIDGDADEDSSRWTEPLSMLAADTAHPEPLIDAVSEINPTIALRLLRGVPNLNRDLLARVLNLRGSWQERRRVIERVLELVGDAESGLLLLDELRHNTRNGNDLYFIERAMEQAANVHPELRAAAQQLLAKLYDHIPKPDLSYLQVETPTGLRKLWGPGVPSGQHQESTFPTSLPAMSIIPISKRLYSAFDPKHDGLRWLEDHPVVEVTWYEAMAFCSWLAHTFPELRGARLPGEHEWAAVQEADTPLGPGVLTTDWLSKRAWFHANAQGQAQPVARLQAGSRGYFDLLGNVREWCLDRADNQQPTSEDPARCLRGGCFRDPIEYFEQGTRSFAAPDRSSALVGFRVFIPAHEPPSSASSGRAAEAASASRRNPERE